MAFASSRCYASGETTGAMLLHRGLRRSEENGGGEADFIVGVRVGELDDAIAADDENRGHGQPVSIAAGDGREFDAEAAIGFFQFRREPEGHAVGARGEHRAVGEKAVIEMIFSGHLPESGGGIGTDGEDLKAEGEELWFEFPERGELAIAERAPTSAVENENGGFFREGVAEGERRAIDRDERDRGGVRADGERPGEFGGRGERRSISAGERAEAEGEQKDEGGRKKFHAGK